MVLAEDDHIASHTLQQYLSKAPSIDVVGIARDGREAVEVISRLAPDVAVVDLNMPFLNGVEVTRQVVAGPSGTRVLIFTAMADDETMIRALEVGATGFLLKADHPHMVINGILAAYSGDTLVSPKLVTSLLPLLRRKVAPSDLNERDRQMIALVGLGKSNAEIAEEMSLAVSTVKSYVSRLLGKYDRPNRTALAALAYEWHLVD